VASRVPRLVGIEGWNAIDAHELRAGSDQRRPRVVTDREQLLRLTR
jgi:hypothetical protein